MNDNFLHKKLDERKAAQAFRELRLQDGKTDFCSNDYLGLIHHGLIEQYIELSKLSFKHGSGGSRLLAGNYGRAEQAEQSLATFHAAPAALLFNSGYDANLGLLSSVPQRGDTIIYDSLSHASLRDGIRLSFAQSFAFPHNDLDALEKRLQAATGNIFVVTESVFSMDGDMAPLEAMVQLCRQYEAHLIVDEAHATGVVGERGAGLVQQLGLQDACFARIHTFGKAVGCHGAVILGSETLRHYLINFSRAFIYTTALPESSVAAIQAAYHLFPSMQAERDHLQQLIQHFQQTPLAFRQLTSTTPIQVVIVPGNDKVKEIARRLQSASLDVRPILYPTVPKGSERLRIVLHAFNTLEEVKRLQEVLSKELHFT